MARSKAARAERDARIYALAVAGRTERQIAAEVRLSPARVHAIVAEEIGRRVGPPAEEYAARREAELHDLWAKAYDVLGSEGADADTKLKALATALKVNESRRKLRGADAGEHLTVSLERRLADETEAVATAVIAALKVLRIDGERQQYALEAAAKVLGGEPDPEPLPLAPGTCAPYVADGALYIDGPGGIRYRVVAEERIPAPTVSQDGPIRAQRRDDADAVGEAIREFEAEFGSIFEDDDGTGGTGSDSSESDGTDGTGTGGA